MAKKLQQEFSLTKHAMDRMRERFPHAMKDLEFEQSAAIRIRKMYEFLWNSTIENRVINDTMFMQYVQEKYGYDKNLKFFANQDMLFIGVIMANGGNYIVTVVNRLDYASKYLRPVTQKMKKKPDTYRVRTSSIQNKLPAFKKKKHREYLETDFDE